MATQGNPAGGISPGRTPGSKNFKTTIKMEKCARLEALGIPDDKIAELLGYASAASLQGLKKTPEYQAVRVRITTGVISELEEELGDDYEYIRQTVKDAVPIALQSLIKNLTSNDEKVRASAANDILDRDGRMAKVSRMGLPTDDQGGSGLRGFNASIADELAKTVNGLNSNNNGGSNGTTTQTSGTGQSTSTTGTTTAGQASNNQGSSNSTTGNQP